MQPPLHLVHLVQVFAHHAPPVEPIERAAHPTHVKRAEQLRLDCLEARAGHHSREDELLLIGAGLHVAQRRDVRRLRVHAHHKVRKRPRRQARHTLVGQREEAGHEAALPCEVLLEQGKGVGDPIARPANVHELGVLHELDEARVCGEALIETAARRGESTGVRVGLLGVKSCDLGVDHASLMHQALG